MGVAQIEAEIKKWEAKAEELARLREPIEARRQEAEQERRRFLLAAADGDGQAKAKLEELRKRLWDLGQEEQELQLSLEAVKAKAEELRKAHAEAVRQQLLARLAKKARERLKLAGEVERLTDALAGVLADYLRVGVEGYTICHQVMREAVGEWRVKDRAFGFLCYRLQPLFGVDLPRALPQDSRSFTESERERLKAYLGKETEGREEH